MASVMAPMNAAPTSVRITATVGVAAGVERRGDQTDRADDGRDEVEHRRELADRGGDVGRLRVDGSVTTVRSMPVIAATRSERRSNSSCWPLTPRLRRTIDTTSAPRQAIATPADADLPDRHDAEPQPGSQRAESEAEVDAAQQPAVAEPDDATAGGEPAEQHAAGRPLQQHRGGVEADHVRAG